MNKKIVILFMLCSILLTACSNSEYALINIIRKNRVPNYKVSEIHKQTTSKNLIVYFSLIDNTQEDVDAISSATYTAFDGIEYGSTQLLAKFIQDYTNADCIGLHVNHKYSYDDDKVRAEAIEQLDYSIYPELKENIPDIDKYTTIFLVYPVWYNTLPMPVYSFLKSYNLDGKFILPVISHLESGQDFTSKDIKDFVPNAIVVDNECSIFVEEVSVNQQTVIKWLEKTKEYWDN